MPLQNFRLMTVINVTRSGFEYYYCIKGYNNSTSSRLCVTEWGEMYIIPFLKECTPEGWNFVALRLP